MSSVVSRNSRASKASKASVKSKKSVDPSTWNERVDKKYKELDWFSASPTRLVETDYNNKLKAAKAKTLNRKKLPPNGGSSSQAHSVASHRSKRSTARSNKSGASSRAPSGSVASSAYSSFSGYSGTTLPSYTTSGESYWTFSTVTGTTRSSNTRLSTASRQRLHDLEKKVVAEREARQAAQKKLEATSQKLDFIEHLISNRSEDKK